MNTLDDRDASADPPPGDIDRLSLALRTHQLELQMQNEELRRVQLQLEEARDRYFTLYELAPVGYLTLTRRGRVIEPNLAAAQVLGTERQHLVGRPLAAYLCREDADRLHVLLLAPEDPDAHVVMHVRTSGKAPSRLRLEALRTTEATLEGAWYRVVLVDVGVSPALEAEATAPTAAPTASEQVQGASLGRHITALNRLNQELRRRLADRTTELVHARLEFLEGTLQAQDAERRSLARELHDDLGQRLSSLGLGLERLKSASSIEHARAQACALQDATEAMAATMSRLGRGLHPRTLEELGFPAALMEHVSAQSASSGTECSVEVFGMEEHDVPLLQGRALLRIAQEALHNAIRHGETEHVSVLVNRSPHMVRLVVEDDGRGFDASQPTGGFGLTSIHERVALLDGWVDVESAPGAGTTLVVQLPLES